MNKVVILAAVAVAFGGILWMKSQASTETPSVAQVEQPTESTTEKTARASVLLFADPREADSNCGCAEIIRLARGTGSVPGVSFREFDTRNGATDAKRYSVRVSPTVIITDDAGVEKMRFEGESGDVIAELRGAVNALQPEPSVEKPSGR